MARFKHAVKHFVKHAVREPRKNTVVSIRTRIQGLIEERSYSVAYIAKAAKVTPSAVYQWLDGTTEPSILALVNMAESVKGLGPKDHGAMMALTPAETVLIDAYRGIKADSQSAVTAVALSLFQMENKNNGSVQK